MKAIRTIAIGLLLFASLPANADEGCKLLRQSALDLQNDRYGRVYAPVTIQGHQTHLLVQTGDSVSQITPELVQTLGLTVQTIPPGNFIQSGGNWLDHFVTPNPVEIGKIAPGSMEFLVMPPGQLPSLAGGTLGSEFLRNFDVEIDFAALKMNLFRHNDCAEGAVVYWSNGVYGEAKLLPEQRKIVFDVTLDGKSIQAQIDTGANTSYMVLEDAQSLFDLNDKTDIAPLDPAKASDPKQAIYKHAFQALDFDGVTVSHPDIELLPRAQNVIVGNGAGPRLVIGSSILRHLHVYLAYGDKRFYATAADAH